jgi:hypothetical protein
MFELTVERTAWLAKNPEVYPASLIRLMPFLKECEKE